LDRVSRFISGVRSDPFHFSTDDEETRSNHADAGLFDENEENAATSEWALVRILGIDLVERELE
jgi:hypothetical protein